MSHRPKKWPSYALGVLENTTALLLEIERLTRAAQTSTADRNPMITMILLGDIRERAQRGRELLGQARTGNYER